MGIPVIVENSCHGLRNSAAHKENSHCGSQGNWTWNSIGNFFSFFFGRHKLAYFLLYYHTTVFYLTFPEMMEFTNTAMTSNGVVRIGDLAQNLKKKNCFEAVWRRKAIYMQVFHPCWPVKCKSLSSMNMSKTQEDP